MATSHEHEVHRLRVIVALNACRRDLGGLELAARLAANQGCDLEAWFVEEVNLLNVADLPFTKEITRTFGAEREFDQLRIERAQRACLSRIREVIGRLNESSSVRASLKILRGHLARAVAVIDDDVAALVLSRRGDTRTVPTGEPARRDPAHRQGTIAAEKASVCVIVDGSKDAWRALELAADIASSQSTRLNIVVPADRQALAEEARGRVLRAGHAADLHFDATLVEFDPSALLRYLRQSGCRLLVVKRSDWELLESVAEAAECPVILV